MSTRTVRARNDAHSTPRAVNPLRRSPRRSRGDPALAPLVTDARPGQPAAHDGRRRPAPAISVVHFPGAHTHFEPRASHADATGRTPRSGPGPDQLASAAVNFTHSHRSKAIASLRHQQTKHLLGRARTSSCVATRKGARRAGLHPPEGLPSVRRRTVATVLATHCRRSADLAHIQDFDAARSAPSQHPTDTCSTHPATTAQRASGAHPGLPAGHSCRVAV